MQRIFRSLFPILIAGVSACELGDEPEAVTTGALTFASVPAVGSHAGALAVKFNDHWFALRYDAATGSWTVENDVAGEAAAVAPVDRHLETPPPEPNCGPPESSPSYSLCMQLYETITLRIHRLWSPIRDIRTFDVDVGGLAYRVQATDVFLDRTLAGIFDYDGPLYVPRELSFRVTVADPVDGNPWTVELHPQRKLSGSSEPDPILNDHAADGEETIDPTPRSPVPGDVVYHWAVDLTSATKEASRGAAELVTRSNDAADRALTGLMGDPGNELARFTDPEAVDTRSSLFDKSANPALTLLDLSRDSRFFMRGKSGSGFSNASPERPAVELLSSKEHVWRRTLWHYRHNWDFLIFCGLGVEGEAYIESAFRLQRSACFDGLLQNVDFEGHAELAFALGADMHCGIGIPNVLELASVGAGISSTVRTGVEFRSALDPGDLSLSASMDLYSEVAFDAYLRVRVLFWTKRWSKRIGANRIFSRHVEARAFDRLGPASAALDQLQICSAPDRGLSITGVRGELDGGAEVAMPLPPETRTVILRGVGFAGASADEEVFIETSAGSRIAPDTVTPTEARVGVDRLDTFRLRLLRKSRNGDGAERFASSNWVTVTRSSPARVHFAIVGGQDELTGWLREDNATYFSYVPSDIQEVFKRNLVISNQPYRAKTFSADPQIHRIMLPGTRQYYVDQLRNAREGTWEDYAKFAATLRRTLRELLPAGTKTENDIWVLMLSFDLNAGGWGGPSIPPRIEMSLMDYFVDRGVQIREGDYAIAAISRMWGAVLVQSGPPGDRNFCQQAEATVAHEIGHALGLPHVCVRDNGGPFNDPVFDCSEGPGQGESNFMGYGLPRIEDVLMTDAQRGHLTRSPWMNREETWNNPSSGRCRLTQ